MKLIEITPTHEIYLSHFENIPVKIFKNLLTGEIAFDADAAAKCLGFEDMADMMKDPKAQSILNNAEKEKGKPMLFQIPDSNNKN